MKIAVIVGTRPEIIKMSPILRLCESRNLDYFLLHTGQHYSYNMDALFFEELSIPKPKYNLKSGIQGYGLMIGSMMRNIQDILAKEKPDVVLVQGDTNSVLAGALAASKARVRIAHIEAGLRSFDTSMAEELNRILTDHISEILLTPTSFSKKNLLDEGIPEDKIFITGNTIVDSALGNLELSRKKSSILKDLGIEKENYLLVTLHRPECVDNPSRLSSILESFELLAAFNLPIVFPVHPRTMKMIKSFGLENKINSIPNIRLLEPQGYLDFLALEANAKLILTDAGGVQEEACVFNVPCVTLRENTERPETIHVGSNLIAGYEPASILKSASSMLQSGREWSNPFGDGKSAERILDIILNHG